MNDQHISGKWVGAYTYGEEYDEPVRGKTVSFEMELTVVNGLLKGACTDAEAAAHFQQPATIEGSVHDNSISFIKQYPHYWQHEKGGPRFLPKLPSQKVCYSGKFIDGRFEGEWEIITTLSGAQGEPVLYKGFGRWFMTRAISDF
ncbi:hypothetical protein [Longitalea arenae]|uniref:hypothetical protein n=1 Tax=Longitalea arenae TaxID=2812558 RepID=UPI001967C5DB|nr:hypothetical protein [Longitalea arenae]